MIGMIDGCHIPIKQPYHQGGYYYNRKDFYSVVLQGKTFLIKNHDNSVHIFFYFVAVCREDLSFTNIFVGFPGRVHDSRVLSHSPLFENGHEVCNPYHLLGDSAYPNISWILTPFRKNQQITDQMTRYNKVHSSIRIKIEQAFGMLKGRNRRLKYLDQNSMSVICYTICTACVIHNICIFQNDLDDVQEMLQVPVAYLHPNIFNQNVQAIGNVKRNNILNRF